MVCGSTARAEYSKVLKSSSISLLLPLGLVWIGGSGPGRGILVPWRSFARHHPLHILRLGGLNPVALGRLKQNARIAQRDGPVAKVGHDEPHRHHVVVQVIDAEDGLFFLGVVGLDGDGHVLIGMHFDGRK